MSAPHAFHLMVKPRGPLCNLGCAYCYYLKKERLYPGADFRMSASLLEEFTRQYIAAQPAAARQITFGWQGGEPTLMGLDFFRQAVEFQHRHRRAGMMVQNALQTNGTLLDGDWCAFLREHNFLVGLSLDGPQRLHDAYRRDRGGGGSFERAFHAARLLHEHGVDFNILTCVSAANAAHPLDVYRFLRDEVGAAFIQFIPIVERAHPEGWQRGARLTSRSVDGRAYGDFLIAIYDEWLRGDVGRVSVQIFDAALAVQLGQPAGLCIFEPTCGQALALEFNGDLYACDHYVEPDFRLGSILEVALDELVASPRQIRFGLDKRDQLPGVCRRCEVLEWCNGGCPKDRVLRAGDGQPGLNYLCVGLRAFFNYIQPTMKLLAAAYHTHRPVEEMPGILAGLARLSECGPGDLCPCGSGRTAGACHAAPGGYHPPGAALPKSAARRRH